MFQAPKTHSFSQICGFCSFEKNPYSPPTVALGRFFTNEPTNPPGSFTLQKNLKDMRRELNSLSTNIALAKATLSRMETARYGISSSINKHLHMLRPVLSLPDDVLRLLFEWTVSSPVMCKSPRRASPWTLLHTCAHWRAIALSHCPLWCDILVSGNKNISHLEFALQRSAGTDHGLDIAFESYDPIDRDMFASLLEPTSRRWRSLTIYRSYHFSTDLPGSYERLTQLDLSSITIPKGTITFRDTPKLVHMSVHDVENLDALDIGWNNLTFFQSGYSDCRILQCLSAVETVIIDSTHLTPSTLEEMAPLHLPSLHALSFRLLSDDDPDSLLELFDILEVPALRRLDVCISQDIRRFPSTDFLARITHLSITAASVVLTVPHCVVDALFCAKNVRLLHLGGGTLNRSVLRSLRNRRTVPRLKYLGVDEYSADHYMEEILGIVEGRSCKLEIISDEIGGYKWKGKFSGNTLDTWMRLHEHGFITTDAMQLYHEFTLDW